MLEWHKKMQERSQKVQESRQQMNSGNGETVKPDTDTDERADDHDDEDQAEPVEDTGVGASDDSPEETESIEIDESDAEEDEREVSECSQDEEPPDQPGDESEDLDDGDIDEGNDVAVDESGEDSRDKAQADAVARPADPDQDEDDQDKEDTGIDSALKRIVPLVQDDSTPPIMDAQAGVSEKAGNMIKQPLPNLKPNDPVVQLILSTCEIVEFRNQVLIFEGDILAHVDGLIKGILSDRATERSYDGYSVSVPLSITRRDVFALSAGQAPVLWQRRVGVERPFIDLYVDVSGSMFKYYGYIPFIYDALKHVMGRVFQFSTGIVEVDHKDLYLHTTGGTSFDQVALHMIKEQARCAIVFSDGMSRISDRYMDTLKKQLEHLVYIKIMENDYRNWESLAKDIILLQKKEVT